VKKPKAAAFILFFLLAHFCAADAASRAESAKKFAEEIQQALPFTTLTMFSWSDAYIGQLISRRPHFGAGISYGMSTADFSAAKELFSDFGVNPYMDIDGVLMPPVYGHARIGGFFVPFDIGFAASLPLNTRPADGFTLEQQTLGGDIRFALVREGTKMPGISIGLAYTQTTGELRNSVTDRDIRLNWNGNAFEIKTQISKTLHIFTPYLGIGGSFSWTSASYNADNADGNSVEEWGMQPDDFANGVFFRGFGGFSLNLWVLRLGFGFNVSIPDLDYGVALDFRFQL
jgi:hypothetical protein